MRVIKYILILLTLAACEGFNALDQKQTGLECPVSTKSTSQVFQNEYQKQQRKVIFQNHTTLSHLPKGLELSALLDLQCINEGENLSLLTKPFYNLIVKDFSKFSSIEAHTIVLPKAMSKVQLEEIANNDVCIIGITEETYAEPQALPNDPLYSDQSYLPSIRFSEIYEPVFTSEKRLQGEYVVAVIDTGFFMNHLDLKNQWWVNPGEIADNGIDDDGNGIIDDIHGANLNKAPYSGDPASINYGRHGTHVAGFIGAEINNNEGITGIMGANIKIMGINAWPAVFPGSGNPPMSVVDRGIRYAVDNGAQVINISMQGEGFNPNIEDAMNYAAQNNVVVVVAAGNYNAEIGPRIGIPAYYSKDIAGAISVAATNSANGSLNGKRCSFSNYSDSYVEIAAPGCDTNISSSLGGNGLLSCVPTTTDPSGYSYIQGTSMASPIVAAAAAYTYALLKELANIEPTAALVEEVLLAGGAVNPNLVGYTLGAKQLDLKGIHDYIQERFLQPPEDGGEPNECP